MTDDLRGDPGGGGGPGGPWLWLKWRDASGQLHQEKTRFRKDVPADRVEAQRALAILEQRAAAERRAGSDAPLTVERYAQLWLDARRRRRVITVRDDETRLRLHILPTLGPMLLVDVRPVHIRQLFRTILERGDLAPRTVLNTYGVLRTLFADAAADELLERSPCLLRQARGELPERTDKDPTWRAQAIFTRAEVEALISRDEIPLYRRVLWALMFIGGGQRSGEASARTWSDYDPAAEPLGCLVVATSYNSKGRFLKDTKKKRVRYVPVHPVLARLLAEWKLSGWAQEFGRPPTARDLIVSSHRKHPDGAFKHRHTTKTWEQLGRDCTALGIRHRRVHDARRTFTTLMQVDGADRENVRLITHGPRGDQVGPGAGLALAGGERG